MFILKNICYHVILITRKNEIEHLNYNIIPNIYLPQIFNLLNKIIKIILYYFLTTINNLKKKLYSFKVKNEFKTRTS